MRDVLQGRSGNLEPAERAALRVVCCGGFWPEERRWLAGMTGQGTCEACFEAIGSERHRLYECGAIHATLTYARLEGRIPIRALDRRWNSELAPLALHALPPKAALWQPETAQDPEGDLSAGHTGITFGDGSGERQSEVDSRLATWAIVRLTGDGHVHSRLRGRVGGWFPTVPRAELTALVWHLRLSLIQATYVGDCAEVIRGAQSGVSAAYTSLRSFHADLWKQVAILMNDHGPGLSFVKTKAHRSRSEAAQSEDDPLFYWQGNHSADEHCKSLCKSLAADCARHKANMAQREESLAWLCHVAIASASCFKHWWPPAKCRKRGTRASAQQHVEQHATSRGVRSPKETASLAHSTHHLAESSGFVWCCKCGAHAWRVLRALKRPCVGAPRSATYERLLKRFRAGRVPAERSQLPSKPRLLGAAPPRPESRSLASNCAQEEPGKQSCRGGAVLLMPLEEPAKQLGPGGAVLLPPQDLHMQDRTSRSGPEVPAAKTSKQTAEPDEAAVMADMWELEQAGFNVIWPRR